MSRLWAYEDIEVGYAGTTGGRTITDADVLGFAGVSGDFNRAHVDGAHMAESRYGQRIAHGLLGAAAMTGLLCRDAPEIFGTQLDGVAFLGIDVRFRAPILVGDTVTAQWRITGKRVTSAGDTGVVEYAVELVKQDGSTAQASTFAMLVNVRGQVRA